MSDLRVNSQPNGVVLKEQSSNNPHPWMIIPAETWERAEEITTDILSGIRPTLFDERKRRGVVDFVRNLIRGSLGGRGHGVEVFPYGSVPLRTFLPGGDIDLTVFSNPDIEDALVSDVHTILMRQERSEASSCEVKDVQRIDAKVKIVKCIVESIVVDISFNQIGGLSTLCFLEQVDRLVGKDHLFKRSIILIKAWCYYESRILGAQYGLISTYALETLVLYIFHLFHYSLDGPLTVLYRFLDYFSKFDWENYCISINGPVRKSSLPDIVAESPENGSNSLLLSEEFLRNCAQMFSVPSKGIQANTNLFPQKDLNIVDPLKENNNLGCSVNRGNFFRIRSALKYGSRKLGQVLISPRERMADELNHFFSNTLARHRRSWDNGRIGDRGSDELSLLSHIKTCSENTVLPRSGIITSKDKTFGTEASAEYVQKPDRVVSSQLVSESSCLADGTVVLASSLAGDAKEHAANGIIADELLYHETPVAHNAHEQKDNNSVPTRISNMISRSSATSDPLANLSSSFASQEEQRDLNGFSVAFEASKPLLDLSGDYDSHIASLVYGQCCQGYPTLPLFPATVLSPYPQNQSSWGAYLQMDRNGFFLRQAYPASQALPPHAFVFPEEKKRLGGTGTYFPNVNYVQNRPGQTGRGGSRATQLHDISHRHSYNNGLATVCQESRPIDEDNQDLSEADFPALGDRKFSSPVVVASCPTTWGSSLVNDMSTPSEKSEVRLSEVQSPAE